MDGPAKMADMGKRGSTGERAVGRKEAVGYLGSRGNGGSKGLMDREFQAYHRTGSHLRGDSGRPNHSPSTQNTHLLVVLLPTTPDVHESQK